MSVSREELAVILARLKRATSGQRVAIFRVVVDEHGRRTGERIFRGTFVRKDADPKP